MPTLDTNKTYSISGQTLQDIINSIKEFYHTDHGNIQVSSIPSVIEDLDAVDWTRDFNYGGISRENDISTAYNMYDSLVGVTVSEWPLNGSTAPRHRLVYFIDSSDTVYSLSFAGNFFNSCTELRAVVIRGTGLLSGGTKTNNGSGMFQGCVSLKQVSMPNVRIDYACQMFAGCKSLEVVPTTMDFSHITDARWMFAGCKALNTIPASFSLPACTSAYSMFQGTTCKDVGFLQQVVRVATSMTGYTGIKALCDITGVDPGNDQTLGLSAEQSQVITDNIEGTTLYDQFLAAGWTLYLE